MLFKPRQTRQNINLQVYINEQEIEQVKETIFLGVFLDENLSWKAHISHVVANKIISRSSFFLSKISLKSLYYSMIYPYLYYCNIVWGSTYKTNLHRLVILQKRVVRIIIKSNFDAPSDPIFKEFHLLKFDDIHSVKLGKFMYSYKNSLLPSKFKNAFILNNQTHSYNTIIAHAFNLPFCKTNARQFSVCYQGPKYFNSLDQNICNSVSLSSFKSSLKQYIYSNY